MTVILPSTNPASAGDSPAIGAGASANDEHVEIVIHLHARVVTATRARRKVNGWLCMEVGDRMLASEPELLVGDRLIWRVPVQWTSPTTGVLTEFIGHIQVDAVSGEILITPSTAEELQRRVVSFAHSLRAPTP